MFHPRALPPAQSPRLRFFMLFAGLVALGLALIAQRSPAAGPMGTLSGRIVDDATGLPRAGRLYILAERDQAAHFARSATAGGRAVRYDIKRGASSEQHTSLSAHPFIATLPVGRYQVIVERGKEYHPLRIQVQIEPDVRTEVKLPLKRWVDMGYLGWWSGDLHLHREPADLPVAMLAEDLNVAMPLTSWVRESGRVPRLATGLERGAGPGVGAGAAADPNVKPRAESAAEAAREMARRTLITVDPTHVIWPINTEYEIFTTGGRQHTQGAVFVLNHKSELGRGVPPTAPVAAEARRQGALLDMDKHNWPWSMMIAPVMQVDLFELTNNHLWRAPFHFNEWYAQDPPEWMNLERDGKGLSERGWIDFGFQTYYALLNCGLPLRPSAGTASGVHPVPPGFGRVYVKIDGPFSYEKWIEGLTAGRSFATTGPMLMARFNGREAGEIFESRSPEGFDLRVTGRSLSAGKLQSLEIIVNGRVEKRLEPANQAMPGGAIGSDFDQTIRIKSSGWVAVRCVEAAADGRVRFAHTGPAHVRGAEPIRARKEQVEYLIRCVERELARNRGVLDAASLGEYEQALKFYREKAERAE